MRKTIVSLVTALLMSAGPASAQSFLGKDATTWTRELDRPEEPARRNAAYALGKLGVHGTPSMPSLLKRLAEDASPKVREAAAFSLGEIGRESIKAAASQDLVAGLTKALKDKDRLVRRSAAYALGSFGSDAAPAKDALEAALADAAPEVRQNVAWALGKLGADGVPGIRKALRDKDSLVKRDAAAALAPLDPKAAREALNELLPLCGEKNSEVRKAALHVLINIVTPEDTAALGPIREALADPDAEVRANAALALSNIGGKDAAAAVPVLRQALRNPDVDLRRQAAVALRNIGPEAKAAVPDLIEALRDADEETRRHAALALGGIGPAAESAVPALVRVIADTKETSPTRIQAGAALKGIGAVPPAVKALPDLLKVLQNAADDAKVRERIIWALKVHNLNLGNLPGVYPALTKVLTEPPDDRNFLVRYDCAYLLGVLQKRQVRPEVMNVLLEYLKDDRIQVFDSTKTTVGGTGQETNSGKANVKEIGKGDGRVMAVQALTEIGPERLRQRPDIIRQLQALADGENINADLRQACKRLLKELN
jgi:HEAT repeat protein